MENSKSEFVTSDINLAAALMSEGYNLLRTVPGERPREWGFVIGCPHDIAQKFQMSLLSGDLMVNLKEFIFGVRSLKGIIYAHR